MASASITELIGTGLFPKRRKLTCSATNGKQHIRLHHTPSGRPPCTAICTGEAVNRGSVVVPWTTSRAKMAWLASSKIPLRKLLRRDDRGDQQNCTKQRRRKHVLADKGIRHAKATRTGSSMATPLGPTRRRTNVCVRGGGASNKPLHAAAHCVALALLPSPALVGLSSGSRPASPLSSSSQSLADSHSSTW